MNSALSIKNKQASAQAVGVNIHGLSKSFGDRCILQNINLQIEPGSFHILIGPSGCGKTTLLRLIGGLESSGQGEISFYQANSFINHQDIRNKADKSTQKSFSRPQAHELSYGFQEPRLLPWRTVKDNVALPFELAQSQDNYESQVEELLAKVGLSHAAELYPNQLSGGMKMRAAIARALVTKPKILLLDEPFGALDEITKNRLDDELLQLWKSYKMTVVLVTHSLSEAVYLGQKIHILSANPGQIDHTLEVDFAERSSALRLSTEFTETVAKAHHYLQKAEGLHA